VRLVTQSVNISDFLIGGIAGYFIGSIPLAYLITKWKTGVDLRNAGSRNIGAMNAFEVTGKKSIGSLVLVADFLKGLLPVLLFELVRPGNPATTNYGLLVLLPALVLGHCYPIWLRFHGGRGLATTAGALIPVIPAAVILWLLVYMLTKRVINQVHIGATVATIAVGLLLWLLPANSIESATLSFSGLSNSVADVRFSMSALILIILSRHIEPLFIHFRKPYER
jgi:glycerol-3-phosphate acyltransferase PlsY